MRKIWLPVILAQLRPGHMLAIDRSYRLDKDYNAIEDLKIKIEGSEATGHGKYVECLICFQVLALLQQSDGKRELVCYHDELKKWLPAHRFDPPLHFKLQSDMVVQVEEVACEGELAIDALKIQARANYTILLTQHQTLTLGADFREDPTAGSAGHYPSQAILDTIHGLEDEIRRLSQDNNDLGYRLMLYEKNLASLRVALRRAEDRSHSLQGELSRSSQLIQTLQERVRTQETISTAKQTKTIHAFPVTPKGGRLPLGEKIRQLFASG